MTELLESIAGALFIVLILLSIGKAVGEHIDTCHMHDGTLVSCRR